jgi:hypothetical protein
MVQGSVTMAGAGILTSGGIVPEAERLVLSQPARNGRNSIANMPPCLAKRKTSFINFPFEIIPFSLLVHATQNVASGVSMISSL